MPCTDPTLRLNNVQFSHAVRHRLSLAPAPAALLPQRCVCGERLREGGVFDVSASASAGGSGSVIHALCPNHFHRCAVL